MSESALITRAELVRIVDSASEGCAESTQAKLRTVAQTTDAVAVGWFYCEDATCLARQARRQNQRFQEAFDRAMAQRFGREIREGAGLITSPFVVRVEGSSRA